MTASPVELLRYLAGGVSRVDRGGQLHEARNDAAFASLLAQAQTGAQDPLPVRRLGLYLPDPELDDALAIAIDRAAEEGVVRALVLHHERRFRVDVQTRAVLDEPDEDVITGIDGVVRGPEPSPQTEASTGENADPTEETAERVSAPSGSPLKPARVVRNGSLIDALAAPGGGDS